MKARTDVLYSGFFCTEEIASRRRLPGRSPAACNRMLRIAKALNSAGRHVELVGNGMSFRARIGECLIHRTEHGVADDIPFTVIPALGLPVLGFLVEPPIFLGWLLARFIRQRPRALIVYNATFASALGVALARLFGIRAVYEVEDLSSVSNALKSSGPERPSVLLQCINQTLSAVQLSLCDRLLVPSTDFLRVLGVSKRHLESALVVTGCMEPTVQAPRIEDAGSGRPLTVLFAGKLERAHGYGLLD